jgi:predicted ester cyclase
MHANMHENRITIIDMVAEGDMVAVRVATQGYHSGELFGLPPTGKWWTNRMHSFVRIVDGKMTEIDVLADVENHIKQIGGVITVAKES